MINIASRILSPTAINTYMGCPQKFYHRYIEKQPIKPSIYLIRGSIIHKVLNEFYLNQPRVIRAMPLKMIEYQLQLKFNELWENASNQISRLDLSAYERAHIYDESMQMLRNFAHWFQENSTLNDIQSEVKLFSPKRPLMGIIDAIYKDDHQVQLVDFKTSRRPKITDDIFRQIALYALLYQDRFGEPPESIGIHFISQKDGFEAIPVDEHLIDYAKVLVETVEARTRSKVKSDYPCTCGGRYCDDFI